MCMRLARDGINMYYYYYLRDLKSILVINQHNLEIALKKY